MSKKLFWYLSILIVSVFAAITFVYANEYEYQPVDEDSTLIEFVEEKIEAFGINKISTIKDKVYALLSNNKIDISQRTRYVLQEVFSLLHSRQKFLEQEEKNKNWNTEEILKSLFNDKEIKWADARLLISSTYMTLMKWNEWSEMNHISRYKIEISSDKENPVNPLVQIDVPVEQWCVEVIEYSSLKYANIEYSENNWSTWKDWRNDGCKEISTIRIILPKDYDTNTWWYFSIKMLSKEDIALQWKWCMWVVFTADNAQYHEQTVCSLKKS